MSGVVEELITKGPHFATVQEMGSQYGAMECSLLLSGLLSHFLDRSYTCQSLMHKEVSWVSPSEEDIVTVCDISAFWSNPWRTLHWGVLSAPDSRPDVPWDPAPRRGLLWFCHLAPALCPPFFPPWKPGIRDRLGVTLLSWRTVLISFS